MAEMVGSIVDMALGFGSGAMQAHAEHGQALDQAEYYTEAAADERVAAADREKVRRDQIRRQLGQQVTTVAKSGVSFSGSPLLALSETLRFGEEDMLALSRENRQRIGEFERAAEQSRNYAKYINKTGGFSIVASKGGGSTGGLVNVLGNRTNSTSGRGTVEVTNRSSNGIRAINEGRTQTVTRANLT